MIAQLLAEYAMLRCGRIAVGSTLTAVHTRKCHTVRDFREITSPPGLVFPYIGHGPLLIKKPHGAKKFWKNVQELKDKYVSPDINMLRLHVPLLNKVGQGRVVLIFDPKDIEEVYRNEGPYPSKGEGVIWPLKLARNRFPDLYKETHGLFFEEGEKWQRFRSKVQQDMMRPQSALFYTKELQDVAQDLVHCIRSRRNEQNVYQGDFMLLSHLYSMDSISVITLEERLNAFSDRLPAEIREFIDSLNFVMNSVPDLLGSGLIWNVLPRRWNPLVRKTEDRYGYLLKFVSKRVQECRDRLAKQNIGENEKMESGESSLLEKLIRRNEPNSTLPTIMAIDMLIFGVDTTGTTLAFLLYQMARNPMKQAKLREEILSFGRKTLTAQDVGRMKYYRACLQESLRMMSTVSLLARTLDKDIQLRGFNVPAQTLILWTWSVISKDEQLFKRAGEFRPERWMNSEEKPHPFAIRQFSYGPRSCIGKRFAELEVQLAVVKLLQNFHIEWTADYDVETIARLVNIPDKPLLFKFTDIPQPI